MVKDLPAVREAWVQSLGRSPGGGEHGNPLQHPCPENPMDREREPGGLQSMGSQKSQARLSDCSLETVS